ncbi:MAG: hypothetical protein E6Q84_01385 [Thiothrix sp.]|nr:MAG: hypothetical protein E6Q84_01385 [Thiothrix sp.]
MKKLNLTRLTAIVLTSSTFLATGSAMALGTVAAGATCKAYYWTQASRLKPDWSSAESLANTWIHCPNLVSDVTEVGSLSFNLEIPLDARSHIFNCYIATQSPTADSSSKVVIWKTGSGVGTIVPVEIRLPTDGSNSTSNPASNPAAEDKTMTAGCYLYAGHRLNSVGTEIPP